LAGGTAASVVLGTLSVLGAAAGPAAAADSTTTLPITSSSQITVDGVHQHVFISDPTSDSIVVTDYDGKVVGRLTSEPGASGLALSADSGTLYVALPTADEIDTIDTSTLTEIKPYSTGTGTAPRYVALAGGKVWFGYGSNTNGNLGSLDLTGTDPVVTLGQEGSHSWYSAPQLATSPGAPGLLAAGAKGQSPNEVQIYDVSSGTAQSTAYAFDPGSTGGGNLGDLSVTPDGKDVVLASGAPYYQQVYKTSDLTADGRYNTATYPSAVAIAPDGTVAGGTSNGASSTDLYLFNAGNSTAFRTFDLGANLQAAGLAWAPDSSRLFALTASGSGNLALHVLDGPTKADSTLTVTAPATGTTGKALTVSGTLSSGTAFADGTTVSLTRTDSASPTGTSAGTATVAADGSFTFTDTPPVSGTATYTASYAGDAGHRGVTAQAKTTVSKAASALTLTAPATATRGKQLTLTGKLTSDLALPTGVTVTVTRTDVATPGGTPIGTAAVASDGTFSRTDTPPAGGTVTYTATYAGDSRHASASAKSSTAIPRTATTVTVKTNASVYAYKAKATITAHLGTTYSVRTLAIYATPAGGTKALVKSGTVDSYGNLTATYYPTRNTTYTVSFAGDARYAPASATAKAGTYVHISDKITKYYKYASVSGVTQYYFHKTVNPEATTVMTYRSGRCATYTLQAYVNGSWTTESTSSCFALDSTGTSVVDLTGSHSTGYRLRMRPSYISRTGDNVNTTTRGAWLYFTFTS
jgi:hypothetical protein